MIWLACVVIGLSFAAALVYSEYQKTVRSAVDLELQRDRWEAERQDLIVQFVTPAELADLRKRLIRLEDATKRAFGQAVLTDPLSDPAEQMRFEKQRNEAIATLQQKLAARNNKSKA